MSNSVFKKWTSAVLHLNKKIKDNLLIAGRNIQLENTGYGIRINSLANRSENNLCKGYFKVINTSDATSQKIKIVDELDITAVNCGKVQINQFTNDVAATELTITADAFIYIEAALVGDPATSATATIEQSQTYPVYEADKTKVLISRVTWDTTNSKMKTFTRENLPLNILVMGAC